MVATVKTSILKATITDSKSLGIWAIKTVHQIRCGQRPARLLAAIVQALKPQCFTLSLSKLFDNQTSIGAAKTKTIGHDGL